MISHSIREQILHQKQNCIELPESLFKREVEWDGEIYRLQEDENEWGPRMTVSNSKEDNSNNFPKRNNNENNFDLTTPVSKRRRGDRSPKEY